MLWPPRLRVVGRRSSLRKVDEVIVPPRDGRTFTVGAGEFFRISCVEGPQVGDLNLWNAENIDEKFYASKTRQLHATHLTTHDRLWSGMPYMRPIATITHDTLDWYRSDEFGSGVHDVIGSRCDPYTNAVLRGGDYDHCCHSNLSRALATSAPFLQKLGDSPPDDPVAAARLAEPYVHDVMNVFMCTGFDRASRKYFMKSTPARRGDFIEFFAEIPLLGGLSACPGGNCGSSHSDDTTKCYPLLVEVFQPSPSVGAEWRGSPSVSTYSRTHGLSRRRMPPP
mmetsp:Transcript_10197/g.32750  ORF Transcript_10197/g.32750 Transcript_10197/m.32750 type:complete len:281 (-) Transcript_10197:403-1245(-)